MAINKSAYPHDNDMEQAVLAAVLLEPSVFIALSVIISCKEVFYDVRHQQIWDMYNALHDRGAPVDLLTVCGELRKRGASHDMIRYVNDISLRLASAAHAEHYAYALMELYVKRQVICACSDAVASAMMDGSDAFAVFDAAQRHLDRINESVAPQSNESYGGAVKDAVEQIRAAARHGKYLIGVPTKSDKLNKETLGMQPSNLIIIAGRPAMGKALPDDALVLTKRGFVAIKDIRVGDAVASVDGTHSAVTGVFPQGVKPIYKITFSDGRSARCTEDHLWQVSHSRFKAPKVVTTKQIMEMLAKPLYRRALSIPLFSGVYGYPQKHRIHPYIMGVLIGDGALTRGALWVKPDTFIADKIQSLLKEPMTVSRRGSRCAIVNKAGRKNTIYEIIKGYGLNVPSYRRFIPEEYFYGNKEERLELLRGLMDTDGHCSRSGTATMTTSSERLACDVQRLCFSLGFKCSKKKYRVSLRGKAMRDRYVVNIMAGDKITDIFSLPRKKEATKRRRYKPLTIVSVEPTGQYAACRCISVSHPSGLFITDNFVVTHNTTVALNFATHQAKSGYPVGFVSLEMSKGELIRKQLCAEMRVDTKTLSRGGLTREQWQRLEQIVPALQQLPIYINDTASMNIAQLKALCRLWVKRHGVRVIYIDYLQLIHGEADRRFTNRESEISHISRSLKSLAKELAVPVVALSQLSRQVETRADKRPILSDLRESGGIEQDADIVLFCYRPHYYDITKDEDGAPYPQDYMELIIAKNRNGQTGAVRQIFEMQYASVRDLNDNDYKGYDYEV